MKYPQTPIRIVNGIVLAYCWNGQEYKRDLPVYRLKRPTKGGWRNARTLSIPARGHYITIGQSDKE